MDLASLIELILTFFLRTLLLKFKLNAYLKLSLFSMNLNLSSALKEFLLLQSYCCCYLFNMTLYLSRLSESLELLFYLKRYFRSTSKELNRIYGRRRILLLFSEELLPTINEGAFYIENSGTSNVYCAYRLGFLRE